MIDQTTKEMSIESMNLKVENQSKVIRELTKENEELYHQYNHLIIRNGKLLKRIDDFQKIIDDLHIRMEEMQLIHSNLLKLNDGLRKRKDFQFDHDNIERTPEITESNPEPGTDFEELYSQWKNFPGQVAQNGPNLRKQMLMLVSLYKSRSLRAEDLFRKCGVGGVTGARYVSMLKKFEMIRYTGARKKGHYEITQKGNSFVERSRKKD